MRRLSIGPQPQRLIEWKHQNAALPQNLSFEFGSFPKAEVLEALIAAQLGLCAYTMLKIDHESSHIEHFKPQSLCKQEDFQKVEAGGRETREDIDWHNLLACHPKSSDTKTRHIAYGAFKKADVFNSDLLINPKQEDPSDHLQFQFNGSVIHKTEKGQYTIETLGLNHPELQDLRKRSFIQLGLSIESKKSLSESTARRLAEEAKAGQHEFAGAIPDVVSQYLERLRRKKERNQAARKRQQSP